MTSFPAHTMVSLLAKAMRLPFRMAARVGSSPATPITAVTTVSASARVAASKTPRGPAATRMGVSARRTFKSAAADSSTAATSLGRNFRACSSSSREFRLAVSAATVRPQACATSRVCRPMEPVDPSTERVLFIPPPPG